MSVTLRFLFVSAPDVKDVVFPFSIQCTVAELKEVLLRQHWPTAVDKPTDVEQIRLIAAGQRLDQKKHLDCTWTAVKTSWGSGCNT